MSIPFRRLAVSVLFLSAVPALAQRGGADPNRPPLPKVKDSGWREDDKVQPRPLPPGVRPFQPMDLFRVRRVTEPRVSPDGTAVVFTVTDTVFQEDRRISRIWIVPTNPRLGAEKALTSGDTGRDYQPRWSPDGTTIAFVSTRSGSPQVWTIRPDGSGLHQVTNVPEGVNGPAWSPDGKWFAFTSDTEKPCAGKPCSAAKAYITEKGGPKSSAHFVDRLLYRHWDSWRDQIRTHVFVVPSAGGEARDVTPGDFDAPPFQVGDDGDYVFSPDSKEILFPRNSDPVEAISTNADLYLVPIDGSAPPRNITAENKARDITAQWSPDGTHVAYRAAKRPGFESDRLSLWLYDAEDGGRKEITPGSELSVLAFRWHPDGRRVLFSAYANGRTPLFVVDVKTKKIDQILPEGDHKSFDLAGDGKTIVWAGSAIDHPAEVFAADINLPMPVQLTHLNDPVLEKVNLQKPRSITYEGAAGAYIQAWVLMPPGFSPKRRWPLLVWLHGGPQGAWLDEFHYRWNPQPFANAGFVVVMPNIHGSEGFGEKFLDSVTGDWGGKPYEDVMRCVRTMLDSGYIDDTRVGAMGGSYGGYMTNWLLGKSDRFAALLSHSGIFDVPTSWGTNEELWFSEWEFGGVPWEKREAYEKFSPSSLAANFKTPTMVTHGELDYRVNVANAYGLFSVLQRKGVPSRLLVFPDEGHWILRPQNSKLWYEAALDWFGKWLKVKGHTETPPFFPAVRERNETESKLETGRTTVRETTVPRPN
jgi:dipeptidyl aminopeptidase/acylaminoacyl peptidase